MVHIDRHEDIETRPLISTWLFQDRAGEESYYPQVGSNSSASTFLDVYIRSVACFFASSVRNNPHTDHVLFTNMDVLPLLRNGWSLAGFLEGLGVEVIHRPLTYATPDGYYGAWRNQFYVFDVLDHLSSSGETQSPFLILDSDCIVVRHLGPLFDSLRELGGLAYDVGYQPDEVINGLTRRDMASIFQELDPGRTFDSVTYYGGEFVALTKDSARRVSAGFRHLWPELLDRHRQGKPVLTEEAHCLSYLYTGAPAIGDASAFIKRIWTGLPHHPTNVSRDDLSLSIWHVPAEKRYGLSRLFRQVVDPSSDFWSLDTGEDLNRYLGEYLGVPRRTLKKLIQDISTGISYKVLNR